MKNENSKICIREKNSRHGGEDVSTSKGKVTLEEPFFKNECSTISVIRPKLRN
jgi:hypothetical protein